MDNNNLADQLKQELKALVEEEQKLGDNVRTLKANKASKQEIDAAVVKLKEAKSKVEAKKKEVNPEKVEFPKVAFNKLMAQRFFMCPSFEIYGGIAGLYDLGPPGTAVKSNLLNLWRQHFILTENMLEVDCTSVTPEPVFVASGHVAKFSDFMVRDVVTQACYRADHLLEDHLKNLIELEKKEKNPDNAKILEYETVKNQADSVKDEKEFGAILKKYKVKAPETDNEITDPVPFNLMFQTSIGPTGQVKGYLRPETAQGIFVNFKRLLEYNGGKLPFAAAQVGQAFRNEIAPRSGLLRVREFTLAEIEHFVDPENKAHPKFSQYESYKVTLFPREAQTTTNKTVESTIGEAVKNKVIDNETLGYFIARVHLFLVACGIKPDRLRFRQHLNDEMAHYAKDCWDAEIQTSYGWIECVGIADRSAFDLSAHSAPTKQSLTAFVEYPEGPRTVDIVELSINKISLGQTYKSRSKALISYLEKLDTKQIQELKDSLTGKDSINITVQTEATEKAPSVTEEFNVTKDQLTFRSVTKQVQGAHITPGVIEPSFGIGRILYSILEHNYYARKNDEQRNVLSLPAILAPVKVSVLSLMQKSQFTSVVPKISQILSNNRISSKVDDNGSTIGKRYSRTDEIGIPYAITIDHETTKDETVTLRERDSTTQVRVKIDELPELIWNLVESKISWEDVRKKFPNVEVKED